MTHCDLLESYVAADKALTGGKLSQQDYDATVEKIRSDCNSIGHIWDKSKLDRPACIVCWQNQ